MPALAPPVRLLFPPLLLVGAATGLAADPEPWDATLHLHAQATADRFGARCLDGSRGGYYFRPASTPAARTKWKFHFMGGGWCHDGKSCLSRSKGLLGSSASWTPTLSKFWGNAAGFYGLMDANDTDVNPFGDWNFVWFAYCDGTSQTSDRDEPLNVSGEPVHFRGRALLDAHLYELEMEHALLSTATEVIVSGTSAGGMSTFMHSSFIKSQLTVPGARLVAVPDAGFWWDHTKYGSNSTHPWVNTMTTSIAATDWNATLRGGGARCLAAPPQGTAAYCYTQPYAYAFLDVPTFVVQSLVDPANLGFCFQPPCDVKGNTPGNCDADGVAAIAAYAGELKASILAAQGPSAARDGHFLTTCAQHEESCRAFDWYGVTIGGQTMNSTFHTWYTRGSSAAGASAVDGAWPSDATCSYDKGRHGNC